MEQGSYGVVKLAYNEDDNTYYVSTLSHVLTQMWLLAAVKHVTVSLTSLSFLSLTYAHSITK